MERELLLPSDEYSGDAKKRRRKKKQDGEQNPSSFMSRWRERRRSSDEEQPSRLAALGRRVGRLVGWRPAAERAPVPQPEAAFGAEKTALAELAATVGAFVLDRTGRIEQRAIEELQGPHAIITPAAVEQLSGARSDLGEALGELRAAAAEGGVPIASNEALVGKTIEIPLHGTPAEHASLPLAEILPPALVNVVRPGNTPNAAAPVRGVVGAGLLAAGLGSEIGRRGAKAELTRQKAREAGLERTLHEQQQRITKLEGERTAEQSLTPNIVAQTVEMAEQQTRTTAEVTEELRAKRQEVTLPQRTPVEREVASNLEAPLAPMVEHNMQPQVTTAETAPHPEVRAAAPEGLPEQQIAAHKGETEKPASEVEETVLRIERLEVRDRNVSDTDNQPGGNQGGAQPGHTPLPDATLTQKPGTSAQLKEAQKNLVQQAKAQPGAFLYAVVLFITIIALMYIFAVLS